MTVQNQDIEFIHKALKGNQSAYKFLYEKYKHNFFLVCQRYMKNKVNAEDCLQEGFINIFKNLKQFDIERGNFEFWARRVVMNVCLEKIRKNTLYLVDMNQAFMVESKEVNVLSDLSLKEMLHIIHELPVGYRTIFNMYVIDGFTHKEIAEKLGISNSTSKTQLMKSRLLLQKKLIAKQQILSIKHG